MVTTTERMVYWVHAHTSDLWPAVTLSLVLEVSTTGLEDRLVDTATAGNNTNHGTVQGRNGLLLARWKLEFGLLGIRVLRNNGGIVARSASELSSVAVLLLNLADDGTLGHLTDWKDVADGNLGLFAAVNVLASVETLGGDHELLAETVLVAIAESDDGEWRTTARIVLNLSHHTLDVAVTLGKVHVTELGGALAVKCVRFEGGTGALTLCTDDATHFN